MSSLIRKTPSKILPVTYKFDGKKRNCAKYSQIPKPKKEQRFKLPDLPKLSFYYEKLPLDIEKIILLFIDRSPLQTIPESKISGKMIKNLTLVNRAFNKFFALELKYVESIYELLKKYESLNKQLAYFSKSPGLYAFDTTLLKNAIKIEILCIAKFVRQNPHLKNENWMDLRKFDLCIIAIACLNEKIPDRVIKHLLESSMACFSEILITADKAQTIRLIDYLKDNNKSRYEQLIKLVS